MHGSGLRRESFCAYLGQDLFYLRAFAEAYSASLSKAAQVCRHACMMLRDSLVCALHMSGFDT